LYKIRVIIILLLLCLKNKFNVLKITLKINLHCGVPNLPTHIAVLKKMVFSKFVKQTVNSNETPYSYMNK